jgi:flagella basal body P-ring formation protein FlgA
MRMKFKSRQAYSSHAAVTPRLLPELLQALLLILQCLCTQIKSSAYLLFLFFMCLQMQVARADSLEKIIKEVEDRLLHESQHEMLIFQFANTANIPAGTDLFLQELRYIEDGYSIAALTDANRRNYSIKVRYYPAVLVPILTQKVRKGGQIDASMIGEMQIMQRDLESAYVTDANELIGKMAGRVLIPNRPIRHDDIHRNYMVHRQKRVTIVFKKRNLLIKAPGVALENGAVGDVVRVKNPSTGKVISAEVVSKNKVLIGEEE